MTQEQSTDEDPGPPAAEESEFSAGYWEDRYRTGTPTSLDDPGPSLVAATRSLRPGRALDAGCGQGAHAVWLASQGWDVTAVDVSATALARARERPGGDRVTWVHGDLTGWQPGQTYDLVTSHHVHVPGPPEALYARLASWVAPGGTLLVVGHDSGHGHPEGAQVRAAQVTSGLPAEQWEVVVAEARDHVVRPPGGADPVTLHDVVVQARRTAAHPG